MKKMQSATHEQVRQYINARIDAITSLLLKLNQERSALMQILLEAKNNYTQEEINKLFS